jgi:hypothetical protein
VFGFVCERCYGVARIPDGTLALVEGVFNS